MSTTERRDELAIAIADFNAAEREYERARDASTATGAAVHEAIVRDESVFELIEARSKAGNAFSEAADAAWQAGQHVVECANAVVIAAGCPCMDRIADVTNVDPGVVAWREWRNLLTKDSTVSIVGMRA